MLIRGSRNAAVLRLCAGLVVCLPGFAQGQEWRFEPVLKAGLVADDNASLSIRTDEEVSLNGYMVDAEAGIFYSSSDITSFFVQPRVLIRTYPDDEEFESDDLFLRSQLRHQGESSTIGFMLNFDQQDVRTGERADSDLQIDDPDEIPNDDSSLVGLDGDRSRWRLSPFWNYRLSTVSSIDLAFDYFDTSYDEELQPFLVDYSDARVDLGYRRSLSNVTTGILTLTGRRFEPDRLFEDNTGYGVRLGFERALSETTRLVAMAGVENTDLVADQSETDVIGDITLSRELKTISMFARYQRAVTANGVGTVELRDTVNVNFNRRLNERIAAGLGVRAYHAQPLGDASSSLDRNYVQLETQLVWYLSKAFVVEVDYRYSVVDRSNVLGERANSNQVGLWFVYQPNTIPKL